MDEEGVYWFHRKRNHFFPRNIKGWMFTFTFVVLIILILLRFEDHHTSKDIFFGMSLIVALLGIQLTAMDKRSSPQVVD